MPTPAGYTINDSSSSPMPVAKQQSLRVCMVAYAFYESDTRILQYATALAKRGDAVDVVALKRNKSDSDVQILNGVTVYRIQSRTVNEKGMLTYATRILTFLLRSILVVWQQHRERPYDLVHVHNVPDLLVFAAIGPKLRKVPVILDIHDPLPELYASKFKVSHHSFLFKMLTFAERLTAAFATHVIIANHLWRDRFVTRSVHADKCSVIRNYPDLDIFIAAPPKEPTAGFTLMYPGSLNWHQGLDVAIRAFARIADAMPEAEFHIYGEGPAKPSLIDLATELSMQKRIVFHEFLPSREIAKLMAETDLAVEPKRATSAFGNEALSTKILEFMALGVPVVASKTQIHSYYYNNDIVQYYYNDDDKDLANQILLLRKEPALRRRLVDNAKKYAQDNNWDARKGEYLTLVDTLVGAPRVHRRQRSEQYNATRQHSKESC